MPEENDRRDRFIYRMYESDIEVWIDFVSDLIPDELLNFGPNRVQMFDQLSETEKIFASLFGLMGVVIGDGGLEHYLYFDGSDFYPEAVESLRKVGAFQTAEILDEIKEPFPESEFIRETETRELFVDRTFFCHDDNSEAEVTKADRLNDLTERFWYESENYFALSLKYYRERTQ